MNQTMTRRFVSDLADGEPIDEIYMASEKQLRPNRQGNLYLQVRLSDKTGSITAMMWNARQEHYDSFQNGDFVRVQGTSQLYNGNMQVLAKSVQRVDASEVDDADFITVSASDLERMGRRVAELLRGMSNEHLRNLAEAYLLDDQFMARFRTAPAGIKNHHAYRGGLIEHTLSLMESCRRLAGHYPGVDPDLLLTGAFLHDTGKTLELTYEPDLGYSDSGQLLGHLVQGVQILDQKIAVTERQTGEGFPVELANRLRHMIVSHHGTLEFGSPRLPSTPEAIALHYLDNLDARMHTVQQMIDDDANTSSNWTVYNPGISRKIFKGQKSDDTGSSSGG